MNAKDLTERQKSHVQTEVEGIYLRTGVGERLDTESKKRRDTSWQKEGVPAVPRIDFANF